MPAVANAVYDAVGVRIDEVPITPEKCSRRSVRRRRVNREDSADDLSGHPVAGTHARPHAVEGGDGKAIPVTAAAPERQH